jgi:hypothetical protein
MVHGRGGLSSRWMRRLRSPIRMSDIASFPFSSFFFGGTATRTVEKAWSPEKNCSRIRHLQGKVISVNVVKGKKKIPKNPGNRTNGTFVLTHMTCFDRVLRNRGFSVNVPQLT